MNSPRKIYALSLLASSSTLICCALPSLLVALGLGSVLLGLVQNFPALIWISENKFWSFLISGLLLVLSGYWQFRYRNHCPADPELARACQWSKTWGYRIYVLSLLLFVVGFVFAYVLPRFA